MRRGGHHERATASMMPGVQSRLADLEADRQVGKTLAQLIIGGSLTSFEIAGTAE